MANTTGKTFVFQNIYMNNKEWSGDREGRIMQEIAREALCADNAPDIVTVFEHAGWYLIYAMLDSGVLTTVGTANDCAKFPQEVYDFWNEVRNSKQSYLPNIVR